MTKFLQLYLFFLFLLNTSTLAFDMNSADFCVREGNTICQNGYFPCGKQHCSLKKRSCQTLFETNFKMRTSRNLFRIHFKKLQFNHFMKSIKWCQQKKFLDNQACSLSKQICYVKKRIPTRAGETYYYKPTECKCDGHFKHKCNTVFCTLDNDSCLALKKQISQNSTSMFVKIKTCKKN